MSIAERLVGDVVILDVSGWMTRDTGYGLLRKWVDEHNAREYRGLLLNVSEIPYMDSACVGELVGAFITVRNRGGTLKITGARGRIKQLLAVAKLNTVIELFDTEAEALRSFDG